MKPAFVTFSLAVVAAGFTISAGAETGRPSCLQMPHTDESAATVQAESSSPQPGSYAKYLMLNGVPREAAISAARNIDHPSVSRPIEIAPAVTAASTAPQRR